MKNSFVTQIEEIKRKLGESGSKAASPETKKDERKDKENLPSFSSLKACSPSKEQDTSSNSSWTNVFGLGLQNKSPSQLPQSFTGFGNSLSSRLFGQVAPESSDVQSGSNDPGSSRPSQSLSSFGDLAASSQETGYFAQAIAETGNIRPGFNTSDSPKFNIKPKPVFSSIKKDDEENEDENDVESK